MFILRTKPPFYMIPILIIGLVIIGYSIAWHKASWVMEEKIYSWISDQRENGMRVEHGDIKIHGFPFFLRATISQPLLGDKANWQWNSEDLNIDVLPYDFSKIILSPTGRQEIELPTLKAPYNRFEGKAETVRISIGKDKTRPWLGILAISGAVIQNADQSFIADFEKLLFNIAPNEEDDNTIAASLFLEAINIAEKSENPVRSLSLGSAQTALSLSHTNQLSNETDLNQWAGAGGQLTLNRILLEDLPSQFAAKGKLGIDGDSYPSGVIQTRLVKPTAFLTTLQGSGLIAKKDLDALSAGLALALLSGGGSIEKDLIFQNGAITVDGNKIADLSRLSP